MKKNFNYQMPTAIIMNVIYSILNTMWAIGCSAAAAMLASSQYDNNQYFIYEKNNAGFWNTAGGHQDVPSGEGGPNSFALTDKRLFFSKFF